MSNRGLVENTELMSRQIGIALMGKGGEMVMADRERVAYDIERCISHVPDACRDCSHYWGEKDGDVTAIDCMEELMADALAMLKEKEQTPGEWVSVTDKLPQRPSDRPDIVRRWYLVALESGCVMDLSYDFTFEQWASTASPVTH